MKLQVGDFIKAGYRKWSATPHNSADYLLQKRIEDNTGTRYFINIWVFEWATKEWWPHKEDHPIGFQPEVQFGSQYFPTMDITLHVDSKTTLWEIEATYRELWESVGKPYYERTGE